MSNIALEHRGNWAERLQTSLLKHPTAILIALMVLFISQTFTITDGISRIQRFYFDTFAWRDVEEKVINSLSASIHIDKFREFLGTQLFVRKSRKSTKQHLEYVFKRKGYWVQAVTDDLGTVLLYAVTSCDPVSNQS